MSNLGNKEIMAKNIRYYMDKYDKTGKKCVMLWVLNIQLLQIG